MRCSTLLALLSSSIPLVLAAPKFTKPAAGGSSAPSIAFAWTDDTSDSQPAQSALTSYQVDLLAGSNTDDSTSQVIVNLIPPNTLFTSNMNGQGVVNPSSGGTAKNAYYLRMTSVAKEGGQIITFSPRFSISGMTGSFSTTVKTYLTSNPITDTSARAPVNQVAAAGAAAGATPAVNGDQFSVAYNMQTGPTYYAPMMSQPPTAITKKDTSPLFPTSSVSIATTFLPPPAEFGVSTTVTQSNTFSVSQVENTASPMSNPADDMQKFLNRWKD